MGISTVTAARIMKGQMNKQTGEETTLAMDTFPYLALSKVKNTLLLGELSYGSVWNHFHSKHL